MQKESKFSKTLAGSVINFLRSAQPAPFDAILAHLEGVYQSLRNISGAKYKGNDIPRSLRGLSHLKAFKINGDMWSLDEDKAKEYETMKSSLLEKRKKRSRASNKLPSVPSTTKNSKFIYMLEHYSVILKRDPIFSKLFKDSFKKVKGNEQIEECIQKVGSWERLLGMVQGYVITANYFEELKTKMEMNEHNPELEETYRFLLGHLNKIEQLAE
ncbi:unnamed protein product [Blepharisma stoltei]|uniref:Uncharacterized protein n=1 Tax=Blepharisma stoltei TaxID=1481888 RepID=A0AAU9JEV1_9CILI|nr:unnamed protein product [Blepharisma stoltei]